MPVHVEAMQFLLLALFFGAFVFWQVVCPHGEDSTPTGAKARLNPVKGPLMSYAEPIVVLRRHCPFVPDGADLDAEEFHRVG